MAREDALTSWYPEFSGSMEPPESRESEEQESNSEEVQNLLPVLSQAAFNGMVQQREEQISQEYMSYLGLDAQNLPTYDVPASQKMLAQMAERTGVRTAIVYVGFNALEAIAAQGKEENRKILKLTNQPLEIMMVTPEGKPFRRVIPGVTEQKVLELIAQFNREIINPRRRYTTTYLPAAQQLYQWIIAPLEAELEAQGIDHLGFILTQGLRSLPIAALHDGQQFLIEQYSLGIMPSFTLTHKERSHLQNTQVLAMGASEFADLSPLPAVPIEIRTIVESWTGEEFLNQRFTLNNLRATRQQDNYGIIHLATHGEFLPGSPNHSYIQLWDSQLKLDQLQQLNLQDPIVELLVLSACRTALGNPDAELGFTGLAVQAGVKSALGSLWYVSDEGTLGLMSEFYAQLKTSTTKAQALQKAQIQMIRGQIKIENGQLIVPSLAAPIPLPESLQDVEDEVMNHPYFWSAFTLIGAPW